MIKINLTHAISMVSTLDQLRSEIKLYPLGATRNEIENRIAHTEMDLTVEKDKIAAAIKLAEGRSRERTVTPDDILNAIEMAEKVWKLPTRLMTGIKIDVDINAQNFPRRYKWSAESTHFTAEHRGSRWYLTDIRRAPCRRYGHNIIAQIPDKTLEYIANRAMRQAQDIHV